MNVDFDVLRRINRRALAQMVAMVWRANHRDDALKTDPKVGGHPAACASCLEIHSALHYVVRDPQDYFCSKPHAAPMDHALLNLLGLSRHGSGVDRGDDWFDEAAGEAVMDELRAFPTDGKPVFQSYHSEFDPDNWRTLPSGTVGIPPVNSVYLALAHRYAKAHGFDVADVHCWSMMGDSEFREGSLMEVMPEVAERELNNVTWIVDYNRQSLDGTRTVNSRGLRGTDADRIGRTAEANGWEVVQLRHGRFRREVFAKKGGEDLRSALEGGFSDFRYQTLLWKRDARLIREALNEVAPKAKKLVESLSDDDVVRMFEDLGGHDLQDLVETFEASKRSDRPTLVIAHTVKGRGLDCQAATGNHSAIPEKEEVDRLLEEQGLTFDRPYGRYAENSDEGKLIASRREEFRKGILDCEALATQNRQQLGERLEQQNGLPNSLDINLKLAPIAHTQWMWGQCAAKLVRIGVYDELVAAGLPAGKDLTEDEQRFNTVADCLLTLAPDVGTSTSLNPSMDHKVFGPETEHDWEKLLDARERLRPGLAPTDEAWSRHIRFDIAEANCMSAAGSFGKMGDLTGVPLLPLMTVYDFFIKRALDQLYYDLYWGSSFILLGTPSGVTLSPEGAQHSWKSDIQMPNLITWEPSFAPEVDWILVDAMQRHFNSAAAPSDDHPHGNKGRSGVLVRAVTRALDQKLLMKHLRRQARFKQGTPEGAELTASAADGGLPESEVPAVAEAEILAALREDVLEGGYRLIDWRGYRGYRPGENVVQLVAMGALVNEAIEASEELLKRGIYANVLVASSPELLCGILGEQSDYRHLREGLGIDGTLHLHTDPSGQVSPMDAIDLAGRRIPIVGILDGEPGLLDNLGSIVGTRQITLATRRFSKSGTPNEVYEFHDLDPAGIVEAAGRALSESALERIKVHPSTLAILEGGPSARPENWKELWPDPVS
ncbi:MAG: pyruvate dehydrogenase [Planctomycetota bacterium]